MVIVEATAVKDAVTDVDIAINPARHYKKQPPQEQELCGGLFYALIVKLEHLKLIDETNRYAVSIIILQVLIHL